MNADTPLNQSWIPNRKCIDLMMGHVSKDVGNRVYNHKTLEELKAAIELMKVN